MVKWLNCFITSSRVPIKSGRDLPNIVGRFLHSAIIMISVGMTMLFPSPVHALTDTTYYVHTDHLGSVIAVTDETGTLVSQTKYSPYGSTQSTYNLPASPAGGQPTTYNQERGYTNQIKDKNTALSYYNARYYDPVLSRFISPDSVEGGNRFAYVGGNPVMKNDPGGNKKYRPDPDDPYSKEELGDEYTIPWYNSKIHPNHPEYSIRNAYNQYMNEIREIQSKSVSIKDYLSQVTDDMFKSNLYNPDLLKARDDRALYSKLLNKTYNNLENINPDDNEESLKQYRKMIMLKDKYQTRLNQANKLETTAWNNLKNVSEVIKQVNNDQAVCGVFAFMGQYALSQSGLQSNLQTVYFEYGSSSGSPGNIFYHANINVWLSENDQLREYVVDPTWNLVMPMDEYKQYLSRKYNVSKGNIQFGNIPTNLEGN